MSSGSFVTPIIGQRVRLVVGDSSELTDVLQVDETTIHLAAGPASGPATLVFATPRGVIELGGVISPHDGDERHFQADDQRRLDQRRGAFRLSVPCRVKVARAGGETVSATTADLSAGGALLGNAPVLGLGERLEVTVDLGAQGELVTPATVVRLEAERRVLRFDELPTSGVSQLERFMADEQRRRLHRR